MITLFLARHGETINNAEGIIMGQNDSPLNDKGIMSANNLRKYFETFDINIQNMYVSDLQRAIQTARIINKNMKIPTRKAPELRETNYGIYNGQYRNWVTNICPQYKFDYRYKFPDGESKLEMFERVTKFIQQIEELNRNKSIIIVTHGGPIRAILTYFHKKNASYMKTFKLSHNYLVELKIQNGVLNSMKEIFR